MTRLDFPVTVKGYVKVNGKLYHNQVTQQFVSILNNALQGVYTVPSEFKIYIPELNVYSTCTVTANADQLIIGTYTVTYQAVFPSISGLIPSAELYTVVNGNEVQVATVTFTPPISNTLNTPTYNLVIEWTLEFTMPNNYQSITIYYEGVYAILSQVLLTSNATITGLTVSFPTVSPSPPSLTISNSSFVTTFSDTIATSVYSVPAPSQNVDTPQQISVNFSLQYDGISVITGVVSFPPFTQEAGQVIILYLQTGIVVRTS